MGQGSDARTSPRTRHHVATGCTLGSAQGAAWWRLRKESAPHLSASPTSATQPAAASSPPSTTRLGRLRQCTGQPAAAAELGKGCLASSAGSPATQKPCYAPAERCSQCHSAPGRKKQVISRTTQATVNRGETPLTIQQLQQRPRRHLLPLLPLSPQQQAAGGVAAPQALHLPPLVAGAIPCRGWCASGWQRLAGDGAGAARWRQQRAVLEQHGCQLRLPLLPLLLLLLLLRCRI